MLLISTYCNGRLPSRATNLSLIGISTIHVVFLSPPMPSVTCIVVLVEGFELTTFLSLQCVWISVLTFELIYQERWIDSN